MAFNGWGEGTNYLRKKMDDGGNWLNPTGWDGKTREPGM